MLLRYSCTNNAHPRTRYKIRCLFLRLKFYQRTAHAIVTQRSAHTCAYLSALNEAVRGAITQMRLDYKTANSVQCAMSRNSTSNSNTGLRGSKMLSLNIKRSLIPPIFNSIVILQDDYSREGRIRCGILLQRQSVLQAQSVTIHSVCNTCQLIG